MNLLENIPMEIQNARISTAGAYICIQGRFLFAIGIQPHNGNIPVVRLGGHREEETGWQCAVREVYEEAGLHIEPLPSHRTYYLDWSHPDSDLQEIELKNGHEPIPSLIAGHRQQEDIFLSLMYLAWAEEMPTPSSEVKGLLLLTREEIHRLCREPRTLEQYLSSGGKAIMNAEFDKSMVLEPFLQLRLLSRMLHMHPDHDFRTKASHK